MVNILLEEIQILREKTACDKLLLSTARLGYTLRSYFPHVISRKTLDKNEKRILIKRLEDLEESLNHIEETADKKSSLYDSRIDSVREVKTNIRLSKKLIKENKIESIQKIWDYLLFTNSLGMGGYLHYFQENIPDYLKFMFLFVFDNYSRGGEYLFNPISRKVSPKTIAGIEHTILMILSYYESLIKGVEEIRKEFRNFDPIKMGYLFYADGGEYEGYDGYRKGFINYLNIRKPLEKSLDTKACRLRIIFNSLTYR